MNLLSRVSLHKAFFLIVIVGCTFINCSSKTNPEQTQIDYATLNELPVELELEIGESENFIPAQLRNLIVDSDGNIIVSDFQNATIDQFDAEGNYLGRIAHPGRGPGELNPYFFMYHLKNDSILVRQQNLQTITYIKENGGLFKFASSTTPDRYPERPFTIKGQFENGTYFGIENKLVPDISKLLKNDADYNSTLVAIVNKEGEVLEDSVLFLKTPTNHFIKIGGGFRASLIPYRYEDQLIPMENGEYLLAQPDSNYITLYDRNHTVQKIIVINAKARKISPKNLEFTVNDNNEGVRSEIKARVTGNKPPFLNVWSSNKYIWLNTDNTALGKEMAVLDFDGNFIGRFNLSVDDEVHYIKNNMIYTTHKSETQGDLIRKYKVLL